MSKKLGDLSKEALIAFAEVTPEGIHHTSLEILTPLKEISKTLNKKLVVLCLTDSAEKLINIKEVKFCLADELWIVEHSEFSEFKDDLFSEVLSKIIQETKPIGVFFPATFAGMSIAPRVAGMLNLGLCAHVNEISIEDGKIVMSRPTFGENIIAKLYSKTIPVMATISCGVYPIKTKETEVEVVKIDTSEFSLSSKLKVRKRVVKKPKVNRLKDAKVVVAGGRGLKNKENFAKLFKLAEILDAEVGATRPACYSGWVEEDRMIGISGISIHPKVYIGFGISGALQHTVGIQGAEFIIAVNTDKEAPLVKMANLALIGDANKVLDLLIKRLQK